MHLLKAFPLSHSINYPPHEENPTLRTYTQQAKIYSAGKNIDIKDKTVIIVDDVMTTGSTINSCAEILLEMGAEKIIAAVAASTI